MRKILLFICVVAFTSANAQFDISELLKRKQAERIEKDKANFRNITSCWGKVQKSPVSIFKKKFTLPNGDWVITNPAYNMPIVVTDIKRHTITPNAGEDYFAKNFFVPGQPKFNDIPNGAAELPLPKTLQELLENKKVTIR